MEGLISIEYTDEELSNCCTPTKRALFFREWSPSFLLTNGSPSSSIIITVIRKCVSRLPPWNHAPHVSALALGHLSDEEIEDPIYGSYAIKKLQCIDFSNQQVSNATILLHFRRMLEEHALKKLFCFCQGSPGWRRLSYEWRYDYRCEDHQSIIKAASLTPLA